MFTRLIVIIGIIGIVAGVFITLGTAFPALGKIMVAPFCDKVVEANFGNTLTCIDGEDEQDLTAFFVGGGTVVITGGALFLVFGIVGGLMFMSAKLDRIIRTGEPAEATILDISHTGVKVNSQPMLRFRLRVQPSYGEAYEAETNRIIPFGMMGHLMVGANIPVKYDPKKPEDVAIDFQSIKHGSLSFATANSSTPATTPQDSLSDKLRELEESYQAGLITQEEYEDTRKRIISQF